MIIDVTGAGSYHGFLPVLVRTCIMTLTSTHTDTAGSQFPLPLATALFSFLYHLASYEAGGEALVSCGMMESLLRVINWPGTELEHVTVSIAVLCCPQHGIYLQFYAVL
jgi:E3 ubiquitin-protein ligase HUWE1